mmetsp:Transcript_25493/g.48277  ORF Transcript_25493/g.48277 Transcript_25493/m.48277 type:complete len:644 (-) Transcript_25493:247-2178(-)
MSATRVTSPVTYTTAVAKEVMALHHHDCRQPQHKKKSVARLLKSGQKVFPISSSDKKDTTKRFPKAVHTSPFDEAVEKVRKPREVLPPRNTQHPSTDKDGPDTEPTVPLGGKGESTRPHLAKNIIQPWHVVLGDCNSRERRTTEATKVLRAVKREFLKSHFGRRKEDWIPLALDEFYKRLKNKPFDDAAAEDIGRVLVRCTPKAMGRVEVPFQYGFKEEEEAWYGIAKQREALDFFLASRDSPTLADELAKHQRNFSELEQSEKQPPSSMMENFRELLDYVQRLLQKAERGDEFSASILDSLSPINKLKIHWKTLSDYKHPTAAGQTGKEKKSIWKPKGCNGKIRATFLTKDSSLNANNDGRHADKNGAAEASRPILGLALYPQLRDQAMHMNSLPINRKGRSESSDIHLPEEEDPVTTKLHLLGKEIGHDDLSFLDDHLIVDRDQIAELTEPGDPSIFDANDVEISSSEHEDPDQHFPGRLRLRDDARTVGETESRLLKRARTTRHLAVALWAFATFAGISLGVGVASADSAKSDDSSMVGETTSQTQTDDYHAISPESNLVDDVTLSPKDSGNMDGFARVSLYVFLGWVMCLCFLVIPYWCYIRYSLRRHRLGSSRSDEDRNADMTSAVSKKECNRNDENV